MEIEVIPRPYYYHCNKIPQRKLRKNVKLKKNEILSFTRYKSFITKVSGGGYPTEFVQLWIPYIKVERRASVEGYTTHWKDQ